MRAIKVSRTFNQQHKNGPSLVIAILGYMERRPTRAIFIFSLPVCDYVHVYVFVCSDVYAAFTVPAHRFSHDSVARCLLLPSQVYNDTFNFTLCCRFMAFDAFLYIFLAWYFDNILPGELLCIPGCNSPSVDECNLLHAKVGICFFPFPIL